MNKPTNHTRTIIDQFSKQAVYFAKLSGHVEATQLLIEVAGIKTSSYVLDIACGAGAFTCEAAKIAKHITGIDLTPDMITRAKALQIEYGVSNIEWHVGDVIQLPFAADTFDVVVTRYSFHHFLNPLQVLMEMVRVCRPGGRVAVADLVLPAEKVIAYDQMEKIRDPSHVHILTESELNKLYHTAGLQNNQYAGYLFELELEPLLEASFPASGDVQQVRELFEADIGVDNLGIGVYRSGESIHFAYPIEIIVGTKQL